MTNKDRIIMLLKMAFITAAFVAVAWADITSQMKFTEVTRDGPYQLAVDKKEVGK